MRLFNADQGRKHRMSEITDLDVILTVIEEEALEIRWLLLNKLRMKTSDNLKMIDKIFITLNVHGQKQAVSYRNYKKIQDIANVFLFLIIYKIQQHIFPNTSNKFKQLHAIQTLLNLQKRQPSPVFRFAITFLTVHVLFLYWFLCRFQVGDSSHGWGHCVGNMLHQEVNSVCSQ